MRCKICGKKIDFETWLMNGMSIFSLGGSYCTECYILISNNQCSDEEAREILEEDLK